MKKCKLTLAMSPLCHKSFLFWQIFFIFYKSHKLVHLLLAWWKKQMFHDKVLDFGWDGQYNSLLYNDIHLTIASHYCFLGYNEFDLNLNLIPTNLLVQIYKRLCLTGLFFKRLDPPKWAASDPKGCARLDSAFVNFGQ